MKLPLGENETCSGRANKTRFEDETKIRNSLRNQVDIIFLRKSSFICRGIPIRKPGSENYRSNII